jgi:hypothetical protein
VYTIARLLPLVVAFAFAASPASAAKRIKFDLTSKITNIQSVDNAPAGASAGDVLMFTEDLMNRSGAVVGNDAAYCVALFDGKSSLCNGVYSLKAGQIMVQLLQPGPFGSYTQAITGGTGRYRGATGTVRVKQDPATGDHFRFSVVPRG